LATLLELEAISDQKEAFNNALQSLQEKQLLVVEKTFVYFSSQYLFQTLKRTSERLNIFGRANILLDLFKESSAGKRPDTQLKKKLDELKNIALAQRDTAILTEIAETYSVIGESLMGQEMFYEAFALFSSAIEIFEQIEDLERAALLCDEMAKRFSKFKKPYYARKFLAEGARLYDKIGSDWKRNALSRSAAMLYEEAGDLYAAESFDAFTRLFYRRAYSLYQAANEGARAKKICQKAREAISNEFYRKEFDKLAQQIVIEVKREN
jgi:tetratricopeptide (TPR) repeat protein